MITARMAAMARRFMIVAAVRRLLRGHGLGLAAVAIGTFVNLVALTNGNFVLARPDRKYTTYYDALGESMLEGRYDVPPEAIEEEAFLIGGKTFGYFGPTPALVRLPLNALFPEMRGLWSRWSMLGSCFVTLLSTHLVAVYARRAMRRSRLEDAGSASEVLGACLVLCGAIGTTLFFLMRSPILYHEASAAGAALSMATFAALLRYHHRGSFGALAAACALALLAFQARASVGIGPMAAVGLQLAAMLFVAVRERLARRARPEASADLSSSLVPEIPARRRMVHALAASLVMGACTGAVLHKNVTVFGSLTGSPPLSRNLIIMGDAARLAATDGGHFIQPGNLRTTLFNYFHWNRLKTDDEFPFVFLSPRFEHFPETKLDHLEPYASFTASSPLFLVLGALGVLVAALPLLPKRRELTALRIVLLGAAIGAGPIFIVACVTQRYLHDTYPLLLISSAIGLHALFFLARDSRVARGLFPVVGALALYTCYVQFAIGLPQTWQ